MGIYSGNLGGNEEMTEVELRENIAKQLAIQTLEGESLAGRYVWAWVIKNDFVDEYLQKTDQILALIKEAGYLSPDKHLKAGYVKLDDVLAFIQGYIDSRKGQNKPLAELVGLSRLRNVLKAKFRK